MKLNRLAIVLSILNAAVLIFVLVRGQTASTAPAVLRAQAIELVDDQGQVRAQLNVEASGEVVFRLRDAQGTIRVKLGASDTGSGLVLLNHATEPGLQLLADQDGSRLTLAEAGRAPRVIAP